MSNLRIIYDNAADRAALSASSTAGALAVSNLLDDTKSSVWRATGTRARLGALWPQAEPIDGVFLPFCNLSPSATVRVRTSNEAPATNQLSYSEYFNKASWLKNGATVVPAIDIAPDGSRQANRLVPTTAVASHGLGQVLLPVALGDVKTSSIFVKQSTGAAFFRLAYSSAAFSTGTAYFNLLTGAVTNVGAGSVATMEAAGGGFWRCRLTAKASAAGLTSVIFYSYQTLGAVSAGDGISGPLIWGAMTTDGPELSSYYPSLDTLSSRATVGTYIDADGVLRTAAANVARMQYHPGDPSAPPTLLLEDAATNLLRNNTMAGAVVGAPGTLPTSWAKGTTAGWVASVVGKGVENGIDYIDINVAGTATVLGTTAVYFETHMSVAAAQDNILTTSVYMSLIAGSLAGVQSFGIGYYDYDSAGAGVASSLITAIAPSATLTRYSSTRTVTEAATAFVRPNWRCSSTDTTTAVDFTVRIGLPQLEKAPFASSPIRTSNAAQTRAADVSTSAPGVRPAGYLDTWQSYDYDSGAVPACPAPAATLRGFSAAQAASAYAYGGGACARHWLPSRMAARGMAVDIADPANAQGYIEAGRLVAGQYWSPLTNADYGAALTMQDASKHGRTDAGDLVTDVGTRHRKQTLTLSALAPADRASVWNILRGNGMAQPVFFSLYPNHPDAQLEQGHQMYCKLVGTPAMSTPYSERYSCALELEEV